MGSEVKFCEKCNVTGQNSSNHNQKNYEFSKGYLIGFSNDIKQCPYCQTNLKDVPLSSDDYFIIRDVSNYNRQFLEAMIELKEKDIIEFESRMGQFRNQIAQQEQIKQEATTSQANTPKCPKCGSRSIAAGQRGYSILTGFIGSGKTVNRCANCGYKWKP